MKRLITLLLTFSLTLSLCACGSNSQDQSATSNAAGDSAATEDSQIAENSQGSGEYSLFAVDYDGLVFEASALGMTSVLTLKEDGTGILSMYDEEGDISSWNLDGDSIMVTSTLSGMAGSYSGTLSDGILMLDNDGDLFYYAAPGADTSCVNAMSVEDLSQFMVDTEAATSEQ